MQIVGNEKRSCVCCVEKDSVNSLYEEYDLGYHSILVGSGIKVADYFPI
jgi:hypothetical protein